jgi:hypothetical protein
MLESVVPRDHLHAIDGAAEPEEGPRGEVQALDGQAPVPADSFETISAGPSCRGRARCGRRLAQAGGGGLALRSGSWWC